MFLPIHVTTEYEYKRAIPVCTIALLILLGLIHIELFIHGGDAHRNLMYYRYGICLYDYHWWAAITCTLLHGSHSHLIGNGLFLWLFGSWVERYFGSLAFLGIYLLSAFISVNFHLLTMSPLYIDEPLIGASGAISGLLGAFMVTMPNARLKTLYFDLFIFRPILIELPAWVVLGIWFIGQILYTLGIMGDFMEIAFWAHLGGFGGGAGLGVLFNHLHHRAGNREYDVLWSLLVEAWNNFLTNNIAPVEHQLRSLASYRIPDAESLPLFLTAMVAVKKSEAVTAMTAFKQAFARAKSYSNHADQVSIYVQMVKHFSPQDIPVDIHRDAGFAASTIGQTALALWALKMALDGGIEDEFDRILRTLAHIYQKKLHRDDLAREIREMLR